VALASARAGNVIGGGDWAEDRLIPDFIRAINNNEKVKIRSPHAIRPWQHVLEPLSGYLALGAKLYSEEAEYAEGWNFGPDDSDARPVEWIINRICTLWGDDASYEIDTNPQPHEATYLKLDCSKAKTRLGWYPKWDIDTAINRIVEWTKAYNQGADMRSVCKKQIREYFSKEL
jgi:CDP-glucose 4,6-dehydratase